MIAYSLILAHDPMGILTFIAGVVAAVILLHAAWYWLVNQLGFMLASLGTKVERWSKIVLPLLLVPLSFVMSVSMSLLLAYASPAEDDANPMLWLFVVVVLLFGVPYAIGRCLLRFSVNRSLVSALFLSIVYAVLPLVLGSTISITRGKTTESTVEVSGCTIAPSEPSAPENAAEQTEESAGQEATDKTTPYALPAE